MALFRKPRWLKPEINEPLYYVHLAVVLLVAWNIANYFDGGIIAWFGGLLLGDIIAHTVLGLD